MRMAEALMVFREEMPAGIPDNSRGLSRDLLRIFIGPSFIRYRARFLSYLRSLM